MEIISEQSGFSREAREEKGESGGALFIWTLVIIVLIGLNAFSWIFCMYVFGNPEKPFCYDLLMKVEKIDPIMEYTRVTAPRGKFLTAKELYTDQYGYEDSSLQAYNDLLMRDYLMNFTGQTKIQFIAGNFKVMSIRQLDENDVFTTGLAIRGQSEDFPAAYIDFVIPTSLVPSKPWKPGDILQVDKGDTCAFVIHITRSSEDKVIFSAVPLVSRTMTVGEEETQLAITPPAKLNLVGGFPLSDETSPSGVPEDSSAEVAATSEGE